MGKSGKLLNAMLKEEWRLHSTFLGKVNFSLFPLFIIVAGFLATLSMSVFSIMFSKASMILLAHYIFVFFGANVGAFGLIGKEWMNRRFGQASLIAYSARTLPVGERKIFAMMMVKDIIYYMIMWIIPLVLGFTLSAPILGISMMYAPLLLLTFTLSFMLGMSVVFFLSMLYAWSGKLLLLALVIIGIVFGFLSGLSANALFSKLPSYAYFVSKDIDQIWLSLLIVLVLCVISLIFVRFDFPSKKSRFENSLNRLSKILAFAGKYRSFVAKDLIDLKRSDGGYGKVFFSFLIPVIFILAFVSFFTRFVPNLHFILLFSLLLGVYSSTIYTWLTQYDLFNQYLFMPVTVSKIIKSKIIGYLLLNLISIVMLIGVSIYTDELSLLPISIVIFTISSFFSLSLVILYTGLSPTIMFMDVFVITKYLLTIVPVMSILILSFFFGTGYLLSGMLVMLIFSWVIFRAAFKKWNSLPQQTF